MEFLSTVESAFAIKGRGLVLVPKKPENDFLVRVGIALELRTPDGRSLRTHITGVEFLKPLLGHGPCAMAFLITRDIGKDDVPPGTEIWYLREDAPDASSPSGSQPI
jgi:hypothetical protein